MIGLAELLAMLAAGVRLKCRFCTSWLTLSGEITLGEAARRAERWQFNHRGAVCPDCEGRDRCEACEG